MAVFELPLKREEGNNTDESNLSPIRDSGTTEKPSRWRHLRQYVTSKEGWFGHYVCRNVPLAEIYLHYIYVHAQT
jgi:hypothetical protein